jgi:hypothetical protein
LTVARNSSDDVGMAASVSPPKWIKPQLTRLVDEAPTGKEEGA